MPSLTDSEAFPNLYYTYNQLIREAQLTAVKLSGSNVKIYLHLSPLSTCHLAL